MYKNQKGISQLFILVILLLAIGLGVYLVKNYTSYLPKADLSGGASLTLVPGSATYNKGCQFSLDINLDTAGHDTDGTDVVIKYDPAAITVSSVTDGTLYPYYPGATIDSVNGKVKISGLASVIQPMAGAGRFATLNVMLNQNTAVSSTELTFDFDPSNPLKTNDSNVVENGTIVDVLKSVTNETINVGSGSGCSGGTPSPSFDPSSTPAPVPKLSAVIELTTQNRYKATVSWSGVVNASTFDKIDLVFMPFAKPTNKTLVNWVYASTCGTKIPNDAPPKIEGSCSFNLSSSKGEYQFRFYSNSATSNVISTVINH